MIVTGLILTIAMFAMLAYSIGRDPTGTNAPPSRAALSVPAVGGGNPASLARQIAITPDGSTVVFITSTETGQATLASQRIGEEGPRLLSGTPTLESDLVARDGSPLRRSSLLARLRGDNRTRPVDADLDGARFQQMLDDDDALVVRPRAGISGDVAVRNIESGEERVLVKANVVEARAAAGHIVHALADGTLWAVPFDDDELRVEGSATQIGRGVSITGNGVAQFAVARNGNVAYVPEAPRWLVLVDRRGRLRNAVAQRGNYRSPGFSPDGRMISVDLTGADGRDIHLVSRESGTISRATFVRDAHDATWTPDGRITYTSFSTGSLGIFMTTPENRTAGDSLFASPQLEYTGTWLRDGSGLVTTASGLTTGSGWDIAFVSNEGRGPVVPVVVDRSRAHSPAVSPDRQWLSYVSNRTGRDEVYLRRWRGNDDIRVSRQGGSEPVWSPDGRELFYRGTNGLYPVLVAAAVDATSGVAPGPHRSLFPVGDIAASATHANYDVSPDGETFVMVRMAPAGSISVLQNLPGLVGRANRK